MALEQIPFGGLQSLDADELVPFEGAILAHNCILDDGTLTGRPGSRNALASTVGSGARQLLIRYRSSSSATAVAIAVRGGTVYKLTDPTSETAKDGSSTSLGAIFGASANISAAQLGRYLYIGTDESGVAMRRMDSSYTLTTLQTIPQGAKPTASAFSGLSFTLFKNLASPTVSGCVMQTNANTGFSGMYTDFRGFSLTNNGNNDPLVDASAIFNLGSNFDARGYGWLAVVVSPHDSGGTGTQYTVQVQVALDSGGSPGEFFDIGNIYDVMPVGGSPNLLFCPLAGVPSATRTAIRYIRFLLTGSSGGRFIVYGYCFLPSKPDQNPSKYYVTFYNDTTGQESDPTEALEVTIADTDKLNGGTLTYPNCYITSDAPKTDAGFLEILASGNRRIFNREASKPMPTLADIGAVVTINGTTPNSTTPTYIRLWKDTSEGRRLVKSIAYPGASQAYSITDDGGLITLTQSVYKPGGTPPPCNAMAAWAGRLCVLGTGSECNRLYVSNYVAPGVSSDPFVQFPKVAIEAADGWSIDLWPGTGEEGLALVKGDALYILSSEASYVLYDLTAPLGGAIPPFYKILERGALGRRAALWAEDALLYAAHDGIYAVYNRSRWEELTQSIVRLYRDWLDPDAAVCLGYRDRVLYVHNPTTKRELRLDFRTGRWTQATRAHALEHPAMWKERTKDPQLWFLAGDGTVQRIQPDATDDDGTAISDWTFSTGYTLPGEQHKVTQMYADVDGGTCVVYTARSADTTDSLPYRFASGEAVLGGSPEAAFKWRIYVTGPTTATLRWLMWERTPVAKQGAP